MTDKEFKHAYKVPPDADRVFSYPPEAIECLDRIEKLLLKLLKKMDEKDV